MRPRTVDLARLGLGALALARPRTLLRLTGSAGDGPVETVVRVLGARYVGQGATGLLVDRTWLPAADAAVDAVHGLTMVGAAAAWPQHRRAALASAAAAAAFALADLADRRGR
jgi:hypothetical protein